MCALFCMVPTVYVFFIGFFSLSFNLVLFSFRLCIWFCIRTYAQRLAVFRLTEELKNGQPNPEVFKEDFVHLVNYIIKLYEKMQELIWARELKMSLNWIKLKVLRNALPTDYQKGILDFLLDKKMKGIKQYNFVVHKFVLVYLKSLNVKRELRIREITTLKFSHNLPGRKNKPKIKFPRELNNKFISSLLVKFRRL